jgi:hypothetical protein
MSDDARFAGTGARENQERTVGSEYCFPLLLI